MVKIAAFVVAGIVLAGCSTSDRVYFKPVDNLDESAPRTLAGAVYVIEGAGAGQATIRVASQGRYVNMVRGEKVDTVHVTFTVNSELDVGLSLLCGRMTAADDAGHRLVRVTTRREGALCETVEVAPGETVRADVFFDLPRGAAFAEVGPFRLGWAYALGDAVTDMATEFVRIAPDDPHWPEPPFSHAWHPHGYYDHYYYPGLWYLGPRHFRGHGLYHDYRHCR